MLALRRRQLPPNMHAHEIDPACQLNLVRAGESAAPALEAAVSSSFAFGGTNAALVFQRA